MIGINDYVYCEKLHNAVNDAWAMKNVLEEAGVEVFYETNCDKETFNLCKEDFLDSLNKGDAAIVFFAGHGCEYNNVNRLMLVANSKSDHHSLRNDSVNLLVLLDRFVL